MGDGVHDDVGGTRVQVGEGEGVRVGDGEAVTVGVWVAVDVKVAVDVGVAVAVGVLVNVGEGGTGVRVGVAVGGAAVGVKVGCRVGCGVWVAAAVDVSAGTVVGSGEAVVVGRSARVVGVEVIAALDGGMSVGAGCGVLDGRAVSGRAVVGSGVGVEVAARGPSNVGCAVVGVWATATGALVAVASAAGLMPESERIIVKVITNASTPTAIIATTNSFPMSRCMVHPSIAEGEVTGNAK